MGEMFTTLAEGKGESGEGRVKKLSNIVLFGGFYYKLTKPSE